MGKSKDRARWARTVRAQLLARATGDPTNEKAYATARLALIGDPTAAGLLPMWVHGTGTLEAFWLDIKQRYQSAEQRRRYVTDALDPVVARLDRLAEEDVLAAARAATARRPSRPAPSRLPVGGGPRGNPPRPAAAGSSARPIAAPSSGPATTATPTARPRVFVVHGRDKGRATPSRISSRGSGLNP